MLPTELPIGMLADCAGLLLPESIVVTSLKHGIAGSPNIFILFSLESNVNKKMPFQEGISRVLFCILIHRFHGETTVAHSADHIRLLCQGRVMRDNDHTAVQVCGQLF